MALPRTGLWAFMWVVCFCYLCDAWRKSDMPSDGYGLNNIRAAIAFSFFSVFAWVSGRLRTCRGRCSERVSHWPLLAKSMRLNALTPGRRSFLQATCGRRGVHRRDAAGIAAAQRFYLVVGSKQRD